MMAKWYRFVNRIRWIIRGCPNAYEGPGRIEWWWQWPYNEKETEEIFKRMAENQDKYFGTDSRE